MENIRKRTYPTRRHLYIQEIRQYLTERHGALVKGVAEKPFAGDDSKHFLVVTLGAGVPLAMCIALRGLQYPRPPNRRCTVLQFPKCVVERTLQFHGLGPTECDAN